MPEDHKFDSNGYTVKEILAQFVMPALNDIRDVQAIQNTRISSLEAWRNRIVGAITLLVIGSPTLYYLGTLSHHAI